jgi:hypothetical protein
MSTSAKLFEIFGNPKPQLVNVNELKTIFSNPKADIPVIFGDITKDSVTAKFLYD